MSECVCVRERVNSSESVCVRELVNSSEKSFVSVSEPFDRVPANEYVHAMVRVQVIVYVKDVDISKVFEMGTR